MAGIAKKKRKMAKRTLQVGRCLEGYVDGQVRFRFAEEVPKELIVSRRPAKYWIDQGWFSANILDD